jgi:hypothetical protein
MGTNVRKPWRVERPLVVVPGAVAEYGNPGEIDWRRVAVDPDAGTVTFTRCHRRASFWCWGPDDEYTCALAELVAVRRNRVQNIGPVIEIVTPRGMARLPESAVGFATVRDAVAAVVPVTRPKWHQLHLVRFFLLMLVVIPVGLLATWLVVVADEKKWLPQWLLFGPLFAMLAAVVLIPLASWWWRKSAW